MRTRKIQILILSLITALCMVFATGCGAGNNSSDQTETNITETNITIEENDTESAADESIDKPAPDDKEQKEAATEEITEEITALDPDEQVAGQLPEDEYYYTMEEVSAYLNIYGHLPDNYITKNEAKKAGWVSSEGNLWDVCPGMCIGGDTYSNYEDELPQGRSYHECDVNYEGGYRGAERLVYSEDGLIYYTADHYENFMLLFGEP